MVAGRVAHGAGETGPERLSSTSVDDELIGPRDLAGTRAAIRISRRSSERLARWHGLPSQRRPSVLMIQGGRDGCERTTLTELAERLRLAQSAATELVDRDRPHVVM